MAMVIHDRVSDIKGIGKWDLKTTRYNPLTGGMRSKLPLVDDKNYPRYPGNVGIDEHLSEHIYTIPQLFAHMGGAPVQGAGHDSVFINLIHEEAQRRLALEDEKKK